MQQTSTLLLLLVFGCIFYYFLNLVWREAHAVVHMWTSEDSLHLPCGS